MKTGNVENNHNCYTQDKPTLHMDICTELNGLYKRKNADYGDSFAKARKEVSSYTLGKLYDKFERYKNITANGTEVADETIEDTLIDMANYCIMELLERRLNKNE